MTSIVDILTTFYNAIKTKFATKEDVKQPDYIQNDSTAADYIKNRPFYSEPTNIDIIWNGNTTAQIQIEDYQKIGESKYCF